MADENSEQQGGGRLRWWRQQEPEATRSTASRWYVGQPPIEQTSVTPDLTQAALVDPIDVGDELEAEALRRATLEKRHHEEGWFLQTTHSQVLKQLRNRLVLTAAVCIVAYLVLYATLQAPFFLWMSLGLAAYFAILYQVTSRPLRRMTPPTVGVSAAGISIDSPAHSGLLRWHEIERVERRKVFRTPMIVFKPKDPTRMERFQMTKRGAEYRRLRKRWPGLFAKVPEAIYVSENMLPVAPDVFMARVLAAQSAAIPEGK